MTSSPLRVRLAISSAVLVLVCLLGLNVAATEYQRRTGDARVTRHLREAGVTLLGFIRAEYAEHPERGWGDAARQALDEWPTGADAYAVYDADGRRLDVRGDAALTRHADELFRRPDGTVQDIGDARLLVARDTLRPALAVLAIGSRVPVREEAAALGRWLLFSAPLLTLLSLAAGYLVARSALAPAVQLADAIAAVDPDRLDARLPVPTREDEISRLGTRFNDLLERLSAARQRTRRFVREAAHQIRTPLTLVLGEAALQRDAADLPAESRRALERILTAARQMQRRVDDLVLLAAADAGERPACADPVELDALVLEVSDLMRHRLRSAGHQLELGAIEPIVVPADAILLREALLELLENACRHAATDAPIRLEVRTAGSGACIVVSSAGAPFALPAPDRNDAAPDDARHLGVPLVQWIAALHDGSVDVQHADGRNHVHLSLRTT